MIRKDREMDEDFAFYVVDKAMYCVMATVNPDGTPYCTQLSHAREGRFLYFHCAKQGQKVENLKNNPNVCLSFTGSFHAYKDQLTLEYESATAKGTAVEVTDDEEKKHALFLITSKTAPQAMPNLDEGIKRSLNVTAIYKISIDSITGKRKKFDKDGIEMTYGRKE